MKLQFVFVLQVIIETNLSFFGSGPNFNFVIQDKSASLKVQENALRHLSYNYTLDLSQDAVGNYRPLTLNSRSPVTTPFHFRIRGNIEVFTSKFGHMEIQLFYKPKFSF